MSRRACMVVAALALAACSPQPQRADNATADAPAAAPAPTASDPAAAAPAPNGLAPLTAEGWGPLKIGMTRAQVTAALGPDANPEAVGGPEPESCEQYRPARAPEDMLVMIEDGRLSSISLVGDSQVKTDRGLGLGIPAAQVRATYGGAVQSSLHTYEDKPAEYLTVWAKRGGAADGDAPPHSRGIRYEVNGTGKVAMIHAGGPSILYVEGCS